MKKQPNPHLETQLKKIFASPSYTPTSRSALFKQLKLSTPDHLLAKEIIEKMIASKELEVKGFKLHFIPRSKQSNRIQGILRMNPRGFGFVVPENKEIHPDDVFIPKHLTATAVDGDLVEVESFPSSKKDKGPEGKVVCVLERGRSHLAGLVKWVEPSGTIHLHSPFLGAGKPIKVASFKDPLQYGDRVIVNVVDWGGQNKPILAEITHHLGHISDSSLDVKAAIEEFSLRGEFPPAVLKEVKKFGKSVTEGSFEGRVDLRETEVFTIDPKTAKDFDDALSLSLDSEGNYHLGVHIADVAHYVKPGTALDAEAQKRCNSTYFPGTCVPMLPEELSNNLCSLKPKVPRLCVSVLMKFNPQGDLLTQKIQRSVIFSAHRFSYEDAKEVLDGKKKSKYLPTLKLMVDLCLLLKKKRHERGSIDFALPEVVLDIEPDGTPSSYHIVEYDITHQLVEEFMLKANEVTAKALSSHPRGLIYRVHEEPSPETMDEFFALARSLGFSIPSSPDHKEIQELFKQAKLTPYLQQLSIAFIRSMKLASYSVENLGHFGLSLEDYCHFTSPIRRYPDLVIQRLLFNELPEDSPVEAIAERCSEQERVSFKAEQTVKTLKKLRLLNRWIKEDPSRVFPCVITKIRPFGIQFELPPVGIEGFIHVSELHEDFFVYEEGRKCLLGENTHIRFCVGDSIEVMAKQVDLVLLEVKWERPGSSSAQNKIRTKKEKKKKKKKKKKKPSF